jgi:replication factor A1
MLDEVVEKIEKQTNLPRTEIMENVNRKYQELGGLITKEGAAYLVARDLGIELPTSFRRLQMKDIAPGMKNINVCGRIFRISQINEFERSDGSKGKVVNMFVSDGTSYVRLPLWNEQADLVESESVKLGDTIQIMNGLAKENVFGDIEIALGRFGGVKQIEDTTEFSSVEELSKRFLSMSMERVLIKDIVPGNFEIKGTMVYAFKGKFLFSTCPICSSSLDGDKCQEHGTVEPNYALVVSCVADDGTGDLRTVFFRDLAEKVCGVSSNELAAMDVEERHKIIKNNLLGRELIISGRVRKNKISDRLEMMANDFKDINVSEESKRLAEQIELKVGG